MSNISIINLNAVSIYLMEIDSTHFETYLFALNRSEKEKLKEFKHPLKKLEFAASRYLKHQLFGTESIAYDSTGAPQIPSAGFISLSHSQSHVGIALSQTHIVGLDLEEIRTKAVDLSSKFCTEEESRLFNPCDPLEMTTLWSLKECLYKLSDRKQLIFKKDILVSKRNNRIYGTIANTLGIYEYELHVESFQKFLITCNLDNGKLLHEYPQ
jgi:4'-phosphopantetheinyl transferase